MNHEREEASREAAAAIRREQQDRAVLCGFANTAMRALLEHEANFRVPIADLAANAFEVADAMLAELHKRVAKLDGEGKGE